MRFELVLAALMALGEFSGTARAELGAVPNFNPAESRIISRNELLRAIVDLDPWLVRRILDLMPTKDAAAHPSGSARPKGVDPRVNPDLTAEPRDALSSKEWLELVLKAKSQKEKRDQETPPSLDKSYEGTLELLKMMEQAKERKNESAVK
jgi:hypothetical protein